MNSHRELPRGRAPSPRPAGRARLAVLALGAVALTAAATGTLLAQGMSENQVRCMQLQQDLIAAQRGGGGGDRSELPRIDQQIAQADRVFQGTRSEMENARCFESFFIFGRGLVRSPKCLAMNARVEDARRQLTQLQQQRQAILGGGGNKRQQAELQAALARAGCGPAAQKPRRGGLFDFFGGQEPEPQPEFQTPVYRSIDPNGRYKTVCVRLCDGFFYPISYSTYGARVGADAERCQTNCAAPAELYVHPVGREIEQAISLQGSAYMDLPVALKYRKEYVKGCSCKQAEYNPAEIEAANKRAAADAAAPPPPKGGAKPPAQAAAPAPAPEAPPAPQAAAPAGEQPSLEIDITGATLPANAGGAPAVPPLPAAEEAAAPSPPPSPAAEAVEPSGSTIAKGRTPAQATPQ